MFNVSLGFLALQATTGRAAAWLCQECLMFNVRGGALRPQPRGLIVGYVVIIAATSAGITTSGVSTGIASGITALA